MELIFNPFHQATIRDIDMAIQKPLFVSGGDDQTLRLWNYETNTIEQMHLYSDMITAIGIHPSGHQLAVAFSSKVSLMNVLMDGFHVQKDYPIHGAKCIRFR